MNNIDIVVDLLKQAYMDNSWTTVLEAIDILQREDSEEDQEDYGDDQDSIGSYLT
jgi:hypothetical protein